MRKFQDKILDNKYNQGSVEFEIFNDFKIEESFRNDNYSNTEDLSQTQIDLQEKIYDYCTKNDYKKLLKTKLKKQDFETLQKLFYSFYKDDFDTIFFNELDLFVAFCDFFNLDTVEFFDKLLPGYKQKLVVFIDHKVDFLQQEKFYKIF